MVNYEKPHNKYSQPDVIRLTYLIKKTNSPFQERAEKLQKFFFTSKAYRQNIRANEICIAYFTFPGIS
jgi:hypothetical protein